MLMILSCCLHYAPCAVTSPGFRAWGGARHACSGRNHINFYNCETESGHIGVHALCEMCLLHLLHSSSCVLVLASSLSLWVPLEDFLWYCYWVFLTYALSIDDHQLSRSCIGLNNVVTSYFTQLKICYLMTTFQCPSDILITSWLFTTRWSTWPGNHLVPHVAELVWSCILIHALRCLPDPKCLFYLSGLSLCFSVECRPLLPYPSRWHGSLPRHSLWWLTCELHCSPLPWRLAARVCVPAVKESCTSFLCSLILRPNFLPVSQTYELEQFLKLSHTWHQVISRSRAPSSYKQSRRHQDVRRHRNVVIR